MDYLEPCQYSTRLIEKLQFLDTENVLDFNLINKAIYWAKKYHDEQFRKSGEPYYTHPLEVAYMVSEYNLTTNVIVTAVLHDVVEDSEATVGMIVDAFSWRIAEMVEDLTRIKFDKKITVAECVNSLFLQHKTETLFIKLFDRFHNLQTLGAMPQEKIKVIAEESLLYFSPIALHLALSSINQNINELCCKHLCINPLNSSQKTLQRISQGNSLQLSLVFQNDILLNQNR